MTDTANNSQEATSITVDGQFVSGEKVPFDSDSILHGENTLLGIANQQHVHKTWNSYISNAA